jgi:hypothetical protein
MSFTYTSNIPLTGQTLNITKNPINSNFQAISQFASVNHVGFNATGVGKHNLCELVAQSSTPPTLAGENSIFSVTTSGVTDIYYTPDAGGNAYQLTRSIDGRFSTFGSGSGTGWTFLPGGLLFLYGTIAQSGSSSQTVSFSSNGQPSFTTNTYTTQVTLSRNSASSPGDSNYFVEYDTNYTRSGFIIQNPSGHQYGYFWWAMGV